MDTLLETDPNKLNPDCYDQALRVAVEKNKVVNAEKLILAGAANIDKVMKSAKQVDVQLMLLLVKAVLEDDYHLISEIQSIFTKPLKGNKILLDQSDETLSLRSPDCDHPRNPYYAILYTDEMTEHITAGRLRTRAPIKLAIKLNKPRRMLDELLLIANINLKLGSVGWSNLNLTELDIKWIKNVSKYVVIRQLNLSQNQLSTLPISIASHLRKCTKLDLHHNNLKYIPASILELPLINELDLSSNKICELPKVLWSSSLTKLDLSYNELKSLPDCSTELCADSMEVLRLEHNQLRKVPQCVCFLCSLKTLDLSHNPEILVLPVDLGRLAKIEQLGLKGLHHLYDPPPSICEKSAVCVSYLKSQFCKHSSYYHMKLMLVGKQRVGKTTTVRFLQGRQYPNSLTVGIEIGKWSYRPSMFKPTFYFSVWDFAGQEEYYATHQVFLSKRSLYLAVWNVLEGKDGIAELKPWLSNIILRAPESRVIIVATHLDVLITEHGRQQANVMCEEYTAHLTQTIQHEIIQNNIAKILFMGFKGKRENVSALKKDIYEVAESCAINGHPIMGSSIPASYEKVDNKLLKLSEHILHAVGFKEMVRNLGQIDLQSNDEIRALTLFLHDIGSLLHFDDHRHNLDDLYFIKPQWLCNLMSTVITVENNYIKDGKITKFNFTQLFKQKSKYYSEQLLEQYLVLFNRFEIALPLDKQGDQLLIPCFLPSERPAIVGELSKAYHYQRQFVFCNAVTPPGLWSRLLSRLMNTVAEVRDLLDQNENQNGELLYWKTGLYCCSDDLLFIIESQGDGISIIYSFKAARKGLLGQLINLVQQIVSECYPGLQFEQVFCCYECAKEKHYGIFKLKEVLTSITENTPLKCQACNKSLDIKALAPDLLLDDIDPQCIMDTESIHRDENTIWSGKFGEVYRGVMHAVVPVIVKFYGANEEDPQYEAQFRTFRAEVTYLQRIKHPCLVGMIGVCQFPNLALVMEDGPMGSLDSCLLKELLEVPRIVVYRIAAQIASALRFLHSIPVIYRSLTTSKVLVWSLSLDDLVNCKLAGLEITTYEDNERVENSFASKLIAPEVSKQAIYDERVDVFSLGVVFLQMLQRSYPTEHRQSVLEWEMPQTFNSLKFSVSDTEFHHVRTLATMCCKANPIDRPDLQEIVGKLCDPVDQLVMDITTFDANCISTACVAKSAAASHSDHISEAWISCEHGDGSEIIALTLKDLKLETEKRLFIKDHQIYTMLSHDNHVWATSIQTDHKGSLLKFDVDKKDECIVVPINGKVTEDGNTVPDGDYGVSLACSGDRVYVGTINGWCLMFPTVVNNDTVPILGKQLSCYYIRSLIVVKKTSLLWISAGDQILFASCTNLEYDQDKKGVNITDWRVGRLLLSPDEEVVWTVHINGHSISAWSAQRRSMICLFNSHQLLNEETDLYKSRIASASVVLDTLWVGLVSGHILAVTATLPQRTLIIMKPYDQVVQVLVPLYGRDNNTMMISIGKDYALDQKQSREKKHKPLDVVMWEVVSTKHLLQTSCLSTGNAWLNDASLNEVCSYSYNL